MEISGVNSVERDTWAFWVRAGWWSWEEATLILAGVIPNEPMTDTYTDFFGEKRTVSLFEMHGTENLAEIVRRQFSEGKVRPNEFFNWAKDMCFKLQGELVKEASKIGTLMIRPQDFKISDLPSTSAESLKKDGRGEHHARTRYMILCAALRFLNMRTIEELKPFVKKNGGFNLEKLSEAIDDERFKFKGLKDNEYGTSQKNISETLSDSLKDEPKKIPD